jgi:hypothetical protein
MAEGVGWGAVKPVTVQYGGRVGCNERRQASVIEEVPLGLMRRILMALVDDPVTTGRDREESDISTEIGVQLKDGCGLRPMVDTRGITANDSVRVNQ